MRSLIECAAAANAAVRNSEASIIEIGQALLEAKAQSSHDEWGPWLTANFCSSHRTARRAMRAARAANVVVDGEVLDAFDAPIDCDPPQPTASSDRPTTRSGWFSPQQRATGTVARGSHRLGRSAYHA